MTVRLQVACPTAVDVSQLEPYQFSTGKDGGASQSEAKSEALGAQNDPLKAWLHACPIRLDDAQRDAIRTLLNGGAG